MRLLNALTPYIVSFVFFLGSFISVLGQGARSIRLNQYNQNNGLSSNYVTNIIKDGNGFLWVGTQEGLNVFDGKEFYQFSNQSQAKHNIQGSFIQDLILDQKRSLLWIQTSYAPIIAFDPKSRTIKNVITHDSHNQFYTEVWTRCIEQQNDILWIGGLNTLAAYNVLTRSFIDITKVEKGLENIGEYNFSKIISDRLGHTWLFNEGSGIVVIDQSMNVIKSFNLDELNLSSNNKLLFWEAVANEDNIYVASSWGLLHFNIGDVNRVPFLIDDLPSLFTNKEIRGLNLSSNTELLLSTANNLYHYDLETMQVKRLLDEKENHSIANVFQIQYDRVSNLVWLGTQSGLYSFQNEEGPFSSFNQSKIDSQTITNLYSIFPVNQNKILAGGSNGIYQIDILDMSIDLLDSTSTNLIIFQDKKNNTFVSNSAGFYLINYDNIEPINKFNSSLKQLNLDHFNNVLQYNDSLILLSSVNENGLTLWNTLENSVIAYNNDSVNHTIPKLHSINKLYQNNNQDLFILTGESIIQFDPLNNNHSTYFVQNPKTNKTFTNFMDMNEASDSYFIGTYGEGLIETDKQFKVKNIYTTQDGLSNNCIYRIFNMDDKKMLMTSNNGLSILDLKTRKFRTYYEGDGLHGNGFEQLCGYQKDNKIYVGGPGGFTIVNTDLLPDSSIAPVLYPIGIAIDTQEGKIDSTDLFMSSFTIPNHAIKTTIRFVAPDYRNADRMTYQYKINELSSEWINLGNQNFVDLIGVNPGTYHFQAKATSSEGTESVPIDLRLDFLPKWYQTLWFKLLLLCLVGGLVFLIQRYRMIQIKKQQIIRTEIANDLHDDIGSTLNSLKIFAHLAQSDSNNKTHIHHIEESISEATVGLRDMIWVLEDEQDTVYEIMERIKKFASPVCLANQIDLVSNVQATSERSIPKKIKRNIFLIAKECINNSVKYAECSTLHVTFEHNKSNLKLIIEDDGKGFDFNEITKGKGLESMKYRASQVQFDCLIESEVGKGTKTTVFGAIA